jgi:hypothetical protein
VEKERKGLAIKEVALLGAFAGLGVLERAGAL